MKSGEEASIEIIKKELSKINTEEGLQMAYDVLNERAEQFKKRIRDSFSVGDRVEVTDERGVTHHGVVTKRMRVNIMVRIDGRDIRVSPWLLRKIGEGKK